MDPSPPNNEKGSALVVAVVFLMLLTVLGSFATKTSNIEIQISGNDKIKKMVFYAADSGIDYVAVNPILYGSGNTSMVDPFSFQIRPMLLLHMKFQEKSRLAGVCHTQVQARCRRDQDILPESFLP